MPTHFWQYTLFKSHVCNVEVSLIYNISVVIDIYSMHLLLETSKRATVAESRVLVAVDKTSWTTYTWTFVAVDDQVGQRIRGRS